MEEQNTDTKVVEVGGRDKGYLLRFESGKAYLTVYPHTDEAIFFELTDITKLLKERDFHGYDMEMIAQAIREGTGEPVQIGDSAGADDAADPTKEDPVLEIKVSRNRMEATLTVTGGDNCRRPTEALIYACLEQNGIVYGIKKDAVESVVRRGERDVCIAEGTLPQNGENASIVRHFDLEACGRPEEVEHGRVDFKNMNLFVLVKKGDLLAERIPATPGTPGMDVYGGAVAAKPGKSTILPYGKNTIVADENKIVADIDGQVAIINNKITVESRIEIKGDVDVSTGNIDFCGSVFVKGSVQAGFSVRADGDIEIAGNISGGTVEGRNITVRAGIQGMQRGHIKAVEDIRSSFAENANLIAGRDIYISEAILHSEVNAGKRIVVEGRRGIIAGGAATAGVEIRVKSAGNQMDTSTKLEVGINPMLRQEYQDMKKSLTKSQNELDQTQKALQVLKGMDPALLSPAKKDLLLRLTKSQFPLAGKVKAYKDRLMTIEDEFLTMKEGKIRVSDFVYPGVKIIIGSLIRNIRSKEQHCVFYGEQGEVKVGPY